MNNRTDFNKVSRMICIVFGLVGIGCLIVGAASFLICRNTTASYVQAKATITDIAANTKGSRYDQRTEAVTFIAYEANGQPIETTISEYRSSWHIGQEITVYYDPQQPQKATTGLFGVIFPSIFTIIGGSFSLVAVILFLRIKKAKKQKQRLLETGSVIYATIIAVAANTRVSINQRHPVTLECRYDAPDQRIHIFHSGNIWTYVDPGLVGTTVKVYVNRENYAQYYVDTGSIPGIANVEEHYPG